MRPVAFVVHRVVVVVHDVIAVVRKLLATVPKVVGKVEVVVVHSRIDDGHHDTCTRVAQFPHLVGLHLRDVRRGFARVGCRFGRFAFGNPLVLGVEGNGFNVSAFREVKNGGFCGLEIQRVGRPKAAHGRNHTVAFHLGEGALQVVLRNLCKGFQLIDDEVSALGFCWDEVGTTAQLQAVVLRFHQHDDFDSLVVASAVHFLA